MSGNAQLISGVYASNHSQIIAGTVHGPVYFGSSESLNEVLNALPTAKDAPFNAYQRQHDPTCLPDTRVDLLQDIYRWADTQDGRCIFWLNGLAGTGKSTIARTVARTYFDQKRLGASFFFSRGGGDVGHAGKFVTSIAVQLASSIPSLDQHIRDALAERRDIASRSLRDQWQQLIVCPLLILSENGCQSSYVLVVDALDECDNDNNMRTIIHLLAEAQRLKTVRLRIFLTSRAEIPIRYGMHQITDAEHEDFVLNDISPSIVNHDIHTFLGHTFKQIADERSYAAGWPGEDTIKRLVQNASGLFIWAATACRYIREGKRFAAKRLDLILEHSSTAINAPEKHLNEIYTTVLRHCISPDFTDEEVRESVSILKSLLGSIVTLLSPLSTHSLSALLSTPEGELEQTLDDLHAILDIPKDSSRPLRLHHPSFRDFLFEKTRCEEFWVDQKQAHQVLADRCIRLMSISLKQDICCVDAPGMLVADINRIWVERSLPPEVQYACLYWIQHLRESGSQLRDNGQVHRFLQVHLLHWLEALGWMRKVSEAVLAIASLGSFASSSDCPLLSTFIHDAKRFILHSRAAIEQAPLQIYGSALIFAPMTSIVRELFQDCIPGWIRRLPKVKNNWDALLQTFEGHSGAIVAIAFSPDGALLASASSDRTVRLWDMQSGAAVQTFEGHLKYVSTVVFSPDGTLLASASHDNTIKVWNARSGALHQTLEDHWDYVRDVVFSPDGGTLASASNDNMVKLWNAGLGVLQHTLKGHSDSVVSVTFSPNGKLLASVSLDLTVKLWDAVSGKLLHTLHGHSDYIEDATFSPNSKALASASSDNTIKLWDTGSGVLLYTIQGCSASSSRAVAIPSSVNAVMFSPDGKLLASALGDHTVKLWDADLGTLLHTFKGHLSSVTAVVFSSDGKQLVSASNDGSVHLWDIATGSLVQTLRGHSGSVITIAFSPDGKLLASASDDGTVKLWEISPEAVVHAFEDHSNYVKAVTFSPDGKLLVSTSIGETAKMYDPDSGAVLYTLKSNAGYIGSVVFSPDGKLLASMWGDNTVEVWYADSGALLHVLKGHLGYISDVVFSPDGSLLASASWDNTVRLWETSSGALLHAIEVYAASALAFSPDRRMLATASNTGTVKLCDAYSGSLLHTLKGHSSFVSFMTFSLNGETLASASNDQTVKLWDVRSGAALQTLRGHSDGVLAVVFSSDGMVLASASRDKTVKMWDARSGAALQTLQVDVLVCNLSFSDDGTFIQTNRGRLYSTALPLDAAIPRPTPSAPIFVNERWVSHGIENILWLPSEYAVVAVHGSRVSVGGPSGQVAFMEFDFRNFL